MGKGSGGGGRFLKPRTISMQNGRLVITKGKTYTVGSRTMQPINVQGKTFLSKSDLRREAPVAYRELFGE